ncbi:BLUF domain-containing protein [bacterium]|nr:MAG: BLUF domain-containing protein [bacterium]
MIYLIYSSVATHPMNEDALIELLRQSRVKNEAGGITGLLLYREGLFMQLLEGPEGAVRSCYERICRDPRHHDILMLLEKPSRQRLFGGWAMAFEKIEKALDQGNGDDLEGFSQFLSHPFSPTEFGTHFNEGLFMLLSFKKNIPISRSKES